MRTFSQQMLRYRKTRKLLKPFISFIIKHEGHGMEKVPASGPLIIIANHRSDLDPLIVSSFIKRGMMWVAAKYLFNIPFVGNFLKDLGIIPISNDKKDQSSATKEIARALKDRRAVGIFPEGHDYILENDFSRHLGNFHSGFARFALKFNADILPVSIIGVQEKIESWNVPDFIRGFFSLPKEVLSVKNRLQYKEAKVIFNEIIKIKEYQDLPTETAVNKIVHESKKRILEGIFHNAPKERRQDRSRRSGTRFMVGEEFPDL